LVSLPSWNLFDKQDAAYRESVLPRSVTRRVSIEAGVTMGWDRYVGLDGVTIGLDRFGGSAPYEVLYREFGLTSEAMIKAARDLLSK
jgi:transketolase